MKNIIKFIIIGILIISIIFIYKNQNPDLSNYFLNILNGNIENIETSSLTVQKWGQDYINNNFLKEDVKLLLLDNYSNFLEYSEDRLKNNRPLNEDDDSFFAVSDEGLINNSVYSSNFNKEEQIYDNRIFEENNKLYIYLKDLNFDNNKEEYITYGHFQTWVEKPNNFKKTIEQTKLDNSISFVGKNREGNIIVYVYFDSLNNQTIKIYVTSSMGIIKDCELKRSNKYEDI